MEENHGLQGEDVPVKKKVGTLIEEKLLKEAKHRANQEDRPLAHIIEDALIAYLRRDIFRGDEQAACTRFCSHGGSLKTGEIDGLLEEDFPVL